MKVKYKLIDNFQKLAKAVEVTSFKNLGHAGASIRKDAIESLKVEKGPSPVGTPPHTHLPGKYLKRSVRYDVGESSVIVGPVANKVGESAAAHEFGGTYKGRKFGKRPFMGPALERAIPRFGGEWRGTLGG